MINIHIIEQKRVLFSLQNNFALCDRSIKLGRDLDIAILDMGLIDFLLQTIKRNNSCDNNKLASQSED